MIYYLYETAERYLKRTLGSNTALNLKTWKAKVTDFSTKKNRLYAEINKLKAEVQEVEAVKKCVEQTIQPKQTRAKTQSRKNNMEL